MKFDSFLYCSALAVNLGAAGVSADEGGIRHQSTRDLADCETVCIDFSTAGNGTTLKHGDYVKDEWFETFGMTIAASTTMGGYTPNGMARIYDTSKKGEDPDLGSPNKMCGGHGVGTGGEPEGAGPNCNPEGEGNVLIIQESDKPEPDDNAQGGIMAFSFDCPVYKLRSVSLMDVETGEQAFFEVFKGGGGAPTIQKISGKGGNSIQKEKFGGIKSVNEVNVVASNSFGVRSICFCPGRDCLQRGPPIDKQCSTQRSAAWKLREAGPDIAVCPVEENYTEPDPELRSVDFPIYGKWCGPGHGGDTFNEPMPDDAVDKACMEHDLCWKRKGHFDCGCDLQLIDDMKSAIVAERGNEGAVSIGALALSYFSFTYCKCKGPKVFGFRLTLPGFGGVCLGAPGVGFATTFVQDLNIKGVGGKVMTAWRLAGGLMVDVFDFVKCKFRCKFNSGRENNIKRKANAVRSATLAGDAFLWLKELVCFKLYTDSKTNRLCARCMIGSSKVSEMRKEADTMSDLVVSTGLWRRNNGCNSFEVSLTEPCAHAMYLECSNVIPAGQVAFGFAHAFAPDNMIYSCTEATSIQAVKRKDLNAMFQAPHTDCGPPTYAYCTSKAHQYCISKENSSTSGGTVIQEIPSGSDPQENTLLIACFPFEYVDSLIPGSVMKEMHPACDSPFRDTTPECRVATTNWCNLQGYKVGLIVGQNGVTGEFAIGCWNPLVYPISTPYRVDPRTKPCA